VKAAGYDGVEASFPLDDKTVKEEAEAALRKYGLLLIVQYWQSLERDFEDHFTGYQRYLRYLAHFRPLLINCQTGKDYFTFSQNRTLLEWAAAFSAETGIAVCHETHRNKAFFAAHVTRQYLEQLPYVRLTADFSHWCTVHESYMDDQPESLELACQLTGHLHTRVGHPEGPQVGDPRAPEWQEALTRHLRWWDPVVASHRLAGAERLTMTTEFGPAGYLPTLPFTQMPVASQWEINVHMKNLLKERYAGHS
jgi:sugar phosphate isomerase/epimerase